MIKEVFDTLAKAGFEIQHFELHAPKEKPLAEVNGITLPSGLVHLYNEEFSEVEASYYFEDVSDSPLNNIIGENCIYGELNICLPSTLGDLVASCKSWAEETSISEDEVQVDIWCNTLPFISIRNGDYLAINRSGGVTYLCHDEESFVISPSWDSFWSIWASIYFIGPEFWMLEHFLDENGILTPDHPNIGRLKSFIEARAV
jgi:hypothetical protein